MYQWKFSSILLQFNQLNECFNRLIFQQVSSIAVMNCEGDELCIFFTLLLTHFPSQQRNNTCKAVCPLVGASCIFRSELTVTVKKAMNVNFTSIVCVAA